MQFENMLEEEFHYVFSNIWVLKGNKVAELGKSIHHHPNTIKPPRPE